MRSWIHPGLILVGVALWCCAAPVAKADKRFPSNTPKAVSETILSLEAESGRVEWPDGVVLIAKAPSPGIFDKVAKHAESQHVLLRVCTLDLLYYLVRDTSCTDAQLDLALAIADRHLSGPSSEGERSRAALLKWSVQLVRAQPGQRLALLTEALSRSGSEGWPAVLQSIDLLVREGSPGARAALAARLDKEKTVNPRSDLRLKIDLALKKLDMKTLLAKESDPEARAGATERAIRAASEEVKGEGLAFFLLWELRSIQTPRAMEIIKQISTERIYSQDIRSVAGIIAGL